MYKRIIIVLGIICFIFFHGNITAQTNADGKSSSVSEKADETALKKKVEKDINENSIKMLLSIIDLKKDLGKRIAEKKVALKKSKSDAEKANLAEEMDKLDKQLAQAKLRFRTYGNWH